MVPLSAPQMALSDACRGLATALLLASACSQPVPGVLTLAPAGMRLSGTCTPHPDGTLTMAADAIAESEAYVDAGTVTITVTAATSTTDHPMSVELWFAGTSIGSHRVPSTERIAIPFHGRTRASGPVAIRLLAHDDSPGGTAGAATLNVEKVVITEP
jgi:hypothetical protein